MRRLYIREKASYLRDSIFAASDGIVTTFAVVAGSAGASLSTKVVLILGFANLFADGFSMASGNYLGTKSEMEYEKSKGGDHDGQASPFAQAIVTFIAFIIAGFFPMIPYVFKFRSGFEASIIIVAIAMFSIGAFKGRYTKKAWLISGLEMLLIGGIAAVVAYITGEVLKKVTG